MTTTAYGDLSACHLLSSSILHTGSVDPRCLGGGCARLSVEESRYLRA